MNFHTHDIFPKIIALLLLTFLCLFSQQAYSQEKYNKEQIDSIAKSKKQNPKNLIKVFYSLTRWNTPWQIPNGLSYERILGKKTTFESGVIFRSSTDYPDYRELSVHAELRYYLHRQKNNYTFKGLFFSTGLIHFYRTDIAASSDITGIIAGFGYQTMIYKNLSFETSLTIDMGGLHSYKYVYSPMLSRDKFDAFQWGQLGFKFGYRF